MRWGGSTRRAVFWLAWYLPLFGLWMLFVGSLALEEIALGALAAAATATAADLVRAQDLVRFHMRPRWLRDVWRVPWQVVVDSGVLAVALWRQLSRPGSVRGRFVVLPFPREGDDAAAAARRALTVAVVSLTPNAYVVGVEGDEGAVLIHQLVRRPGGEIPTSILEE